MAASQKDLFGEKRDNMEKFEGDDPGTMQLGDAP